MHRERGEAFGRVEQELHQERAAALGRIGRTLESLLQKLEDLRVRATTTTAADREQLIAEYAETRGRAAVTWRWYLEVQREAVGMRRHDRLDDMYRVPPPLD